MRLRSFLFFFAASTRLVAGDSTFSPARPPAVPLAVRSPYLSTWIDSGNGGYLAGQWPVFWTNQITGWAGLIRVDNTTYTWMGDPGPQVVTQTAFKYTSTSSVFTMNVGGKVEMTVTFLSPVTPDDLKRQSLVFSYLNVGVESLDGATHDVQLYSDISAEWVSGNRSTVAQWNFGTVDGIAYHQVFRQNQLLFSEISDQGEWGDIYWATNSADALTYQSGADVDVRGAFGTSGRLANTADTDYRSIQERWPVFGFAVNLGSVGSSSVDTLFSIGLVQTNAVQFAGANGAAPLPSLWTSYFSDDLAALSFFHQDYGTSSQLAATFDNKVAVNSIAAAGQDYLTITSLTVRQAFGATQLVGTTTTPQLVLKEISSDGNVQTVDVIFPFHPILLYTNPTLLKLLLDPLFENQESGQYPNKYAMHDLGSHYPNGTGHPAGNDEKQPLEECGNMLIMTLAYAQRANDSAYLTQHYDKLKQWTGYLIDEALYPDNQISTDDFAGALANQTNLALKGIIGIESMAVIAGLTGNTADHDNYTSIAHNYVSQWQILGTAQDASPPHTTLGYGLNDTHGLLYNLYADRELNLNLVPQSVYDMQSTFYRTVENTYGVPLDTRHNYTKGDWEMFTAAIAAPATRDMFIKSLATWINATPTNRPMTDLFDTLTSGFDVGPFVARPVMGASFALLALPAPLA